MGYCLEAIISTKSSLEKHVADYSSVCIVPLNCDLALIPISDELLDEIGASGTFGKFYKLTPALHEWARSISKNCAVAYVEAEFFGGVGGQSSIVWKEGVEVLAPSEAEDAINEALRILGIVGSRDCDEFQTVGLQRHRGIAGWLTDLRAIRNAH